MVSFNITGEDFSPLVTYSPAGMWADSATNDPLTPDSSASSLHVTSVPGATASVTFNGTGIWLFGGHDPDYGLYNITVDGKLVMSGNATSQTPIAQQLLGGASGLDPGPHTAVLIAEGSLDFDFFTFETEFGSASATVSNTTIDDSNSTIIYGPSSSDWIPSLGSDLINGTLHSTQTGGATANYSFFGDAVAVYGTVSPDNANYTVTIDGANYAFDGSATSTIAHPQALLFWAANLGSNQHTLVLTAEPDANVNASGQPSTGRTMDLDAIRVFDASSPPPHGLDTELVIIISSVVGVVIGLLAILLFAFCLRRRRLRRNAQRSRPRPRASDLPIQTPPRDDEPKGNIAPIYEKFASSSTHSSSTPAIGSSPLSQAPEPAVVKDFSSHYALHKLAMENASSTHSRSGSLSSQRSQGSNSRLLPKKSKSARAQGPDSRSSSPSNNSKRKLRMSMESFVSRDPTPKFQMVDAPSRPSTRPPSLALSVVGEKFGKSAKSDEVPLPPAIDFAALQVPMPTRGARPGSPGLTTPVGERIPGQAFAM